MHWDLEELARIQLEAANLSVPVDPEELVLHHRLEVRDASASPTGRCQQGLLIGRAILVDETLRMQRRAFSIAHELAHWILRTAGLPDRESTCDYLASAMLLPRDDFERDLRRLGWDLIALCARHRHASFEAVGRRICALRDARMFVFDRPLAGQADPRWYSVPHGLRPTSDERAAATEAMRCGAPVEIRAGVVAWPVLEHDWHRVITLATL